MNRLEMDVRGGNLRLRCLGSLHITQAGQLLTGFISRKAQALLCYLVLAEGPQSRSELADLLWGEMAEDVAHRNLRIALSNLNKLVRPHLQTTRQTVTFNRDVPYWMDVEIFQHKVNYALRHHAFEMLKAVVDLYKGDYLEGFFVKNAPRFEEWMLAQRERLRAQVVQALNQLSAHCEACGEFHEGITYTSRLLQMEPWREEAHRQMMLLLWRSGQRSAALVQFEQCKRILKQELDAEPLQSTQELYEQIKTAQPTSREDSNL